MLTVIFTRPVAPGTRAICKVQVRCQTYRVAFKTLVDIVGVVPAKSFRWDAFRSSVNGLTEAGVIITREGD